MKIVSMINDPLVCQADANSMTCQSRQQSAMIENSERWFCPGTYKVDAPTRCWCCANLWHQKMRWIFWTNNDCHDSCDDQWLRDLKLEQSQNWFKWKCWNSKSQEVFSKETTTRCISKGLGDSKCVTELMVGVWWAFILWELIASSSFYFVLFRFWFWFRSPLIRKDGEGRTWRVFFVVVSWFFI